MLERRLLAIAEVLDGPDPSRPAKSDTVPYRSLLESIVPLPNPD